MMYDVDNVNGKPISLPQYPNKTVQVSGTFNGATVHIQGTNDPGLTEWCLLEDVEDGAALSFTDDGLKTISQNALYIRPVCVGGDSSTQLNVNIVCRRD